MAKKVKFILNRAAFKQLILQGGGVDMAPALYDALGGGDDVVIEQSSSARVRARVYGAMKDEVEYGLLSKRLGGKGMVRYTTKGGKTRWASQAQVDNWSRGRR